MKSSRQRAFSQLEVEGFELNYFISPKDLKRFDFSVVDTGSMAVVCDFIVDLEHISKELLSIPKNIPVLLKVATNQDFNASNENLCIFLEDLAPEFVFRSFSPPIQPGIPVWISRRLRLPILYLLTGDSYTGKSSAARRLNHNRRINGDDEIFKLKTNDIQEYSNLRIVALRGLEIPDMSVVIEDIYFAGLIRELTGYLLRDVKPNEDIVIDLFLFKQALKICLKSFESAGYRVYLIQHGQSRILINPRFPSNWKIRLKSPLWRAKTLIQKTTDGLLRTTKAEPRKQ